VLQSEPDFIHSHIGLGDLARSRGAIQRAVAHYQKVLEIDPFHESTRRKLQGLQPE
jgi:lipopolysaccharide biosynthesis regulator YciM